MHLHTYLHAQPGKGNGVVLANQAAHKNFTQNGQFIDPKGAADRSQLVLSNLPTKLSNKLGHLASTAKPKVGFAYQQPTEGEDQAR